MEFAVAAFSAVSSVAMSKLCMVIRKLGGKPKIDATFLKDELESIRAAIIQLCPSSGDPVRCLRIVWMAQLRRLAYDIEDSIDRFDANKIDPEAFAIQLGELKQRSLDTTDRINRFRFAEQGTAQGASVVANDAPDFLLGDKSRHDCLVYLYLFPPNQPVRTKPLMRRWLAEGLVQREDAADKNLRDLTDSSYISSVQRSINGRVKRCKTTQETLENIAQRSLSEKFILVCDGTAQLQEEEARRLSVHPSQDVQLNLPQDLSRLRTLAVFPAGAASLASYEDVLDFARYGVLRVLDLKECAHLSEDHIQAICEQVLMKYLSINLGSIDRIDRDIRELKQLETLDLSGNKTVTVYKEVLLLPKLKHLLGKFQLSKTDTVIDTYIPIWVVTSDLQEFLTRKSKLETLAGFVTDRRPGFPQLMSLMKPLRKVKIWFQSDASRRNLCDISTAIMKFIRGGPGQPDLSRSLSMDFEACSREFVNEIVPVDGKLDSLKLRGRLSQFPPFVARLSAIVEMCLCLTGLTWEVIQAGLRYVGGLKYLKLIEGELGRIEIRPAHLRSIERICVVCVPKLDIAIQVDALPNLVSLHMLCQKLDVNPGSTGIEIAHMEKLEEIALHPLVEVGIKTQWQQAASLHPHKPVRVIEGP